MRAEARAQKGSETENRKSGHAGSKVRIQKGSRAGGEGRSRAERKNGRAQPWQDYAQYRLSKKEYVRYLGMYVLLDFFISYLFFYSYLAFVLLLPGAVLFLREQKKTLQKKREREIKREFTDGMQMVTASLQAGYSPENALREALKELAKVYEADTFIVREFRLIETQLQMSRSIEELFTDLGRRSAVRDIQSFAEVFLTAKRSGGDLTAVIRNTVSCIRQKQETLQEIETSLAGKVMEQNIMSCIPLVILAYVKLTSPEFLEVLYESAAGMAVMVLCFLVYVLAYFWGRKIVRIEV